MAIISMGKFTAIGMRVKIEDKNALVINTCNGNDTSARGSYTDWIWCNPTNRAIPHHYNGVVAVSTESLWQGTKIFELGGVPNQTILGGDWRQGKAKRPLGAWRGDGIPLITSPGAARRAIYLPAYRALIEHWIRDNQVSEWVSEARNHKGPVYLRDHDTGRGVDRSGPMSHGWVLCEWLNTGKWPGLEL